MGEMLDLSLKLYFHYMCQHKNCIAIEEKLKSLDEQERKSLLDSRVDDPEEPHMGGYSGLHFAAQSGCIFTVNLLIKYGADVNLMAEIGSPLHVSLLFCNKEVFLVLLEKGADVNRLVDGNVNAFQLFFEDTYELESVSISWIKLLHDTGCNINHQNSFGNTALHLAPIFAIEAVLECGADINIVNKMGKTAFIYQEAYNNAQLEFYLTACKHIIKLNFINFYVNDQNRNFLDNTMMKFDSNGTFNENILTFKEQCLDSISKLKSIRLSPKTTMYDTLFFDTTTLTYYVENDTLKELHSMHDFNSNFYPFSDILKMQLKIAKTRRQLINEATFILEDIFLTIIPKYCIEKILDFLPNNSLRDLISKSNMLD